MHAVRSTYRLNRPAHFHQWTILPAKDSIINSKRLNLRPRPTLVSLLGHTVASIVGRDEGGPCEIAISHLALKITSGSPWTESIRYIHTGGVRSQTGLNTGRIHSQGQDPPFPPTLWILNICARFQWVFHNRNISTQGSLLTLVEHLSC